MAMDTWEQAHKMAEVCQDKQASAPNCPGPLRCLQDAQEVPAVCVLRNSNLECVMRSVRDSWWGSSWTTEYWGSLLGPVRGEEGRRKPFPGICWSSTFEGRMKELGTNSDPSVSVPTSWATCSCCNIPRFLISYFFLPISYFRK